ncbi:hypothetical protein SAMN06295945_0024 [Polynucleobacter meluiroseus]|uniref:Lipoprotein n=1 Tax=Polynucleobacter meluiroseus TaxID=1938814 RepID=A0A240DWZ8_9BURK|nr:hypothetical protein [Polynucleobacter meluiroseus]SNX27708.1 hypothetical protein SAMN06295945_0024 [Polynucleobacter meluiroseus]
MKKILSYICLSTVILAGCASNKSNSSDAISASNDGLQKQVQAVQQKMSACIADVNKTEDAKYVDSYVIAITPNNPNAKKLFNSADFITDEQATILKRFKDSTLQCRGITKELPKPEMVAVYEYYYSKVDDVYADLISKRITIGVANQERSMRIQYTREKWAAVMKAQKAS